MHLLGGKLEPCGAGCRRFDLVPTGDVATLVTKEKGKEYRATVPVRWRRHANSKARRLLERAQATMRALRTLREDERLTSGPGTFVHTRYRLAAPHRFAYTTSSGSRSIVIGRHEWDRVGDEPWQAQPFSGLSTLQTHDFFRWTPYAGTPRLLGVRWEGHRHVAEVVIADTATPVWFRLKIDLRTSRVLEDRMITGAHFMTRHYFAFNKPVRIEPPRHSVHLGAG